MSLDRIGDIAHEGFEDIEFLTLEPVDGTITVPEPHLLFQADFQRLGSDLLLVNDGAPTLRIPDYFLTQPPAPLFVPDGAQLGGEIVARLAGPLAPGQYAQASQDRGGDPIGQVETLDGPASVQRADGTIEELSIGTLIFENDVVETSATGGVSLTFVDGTIFTLTAASRMVIDSLIYDPDSSSNSGTFNLVQGSFVFIAGQVAKTGGMDVTTPSATMGIRGTTVIARIVTEDGVVTTEATLTRDADGGLGEVELFSATGERIATMTGTDSKWIVSSNGRSFEVARSPIDELSDDQIIAEAFAALDAATQRVAQGETFVTLPDPRGSISTDPTTSGNPGGQSDVDQIDEPIIIAPDNGAGEGGNDGGGFGFGDQPSDLPPLEANDISVQGPEDVGVDGTISGAIDTGGEGGVVFELQTPPENGGVILNPDGTFTYAPDENFNGIDTFTFSATAADGSQDQGTVVVDVLPVNDAPVLPDSTIDTQEDTIISGQLAATDVEGDALTYSVEQEPANGSLTLLASGAFGYVPGPDFTGQDSFQVLVTDAGGATDTATVVVSVAAVNDAPVPDSPPDELSGTVAADDATPQASGTLSATDADVGDSLTWSGSQAGNFGSLTVNADGTWQYDLNPELARPLGEGATELEEFTVTVTDSAGATATEVIAITVSGANDSPVLSTPPVDEGLVEPADASGGYAASGQFAATDVDQGDALSFAFADTAVTLRDAEGVVIPNGSEAGLTADEVAAIQAALSVDADGLWTFDLAPGIVADRLAEGQTLDLSAQVVLSDSSGATNGVADNQPFLLQLTGTNDAPVIVTADAAGAVTEGSILTASGQVSVEDLDIGDPILAEVRPQAAGYVGTLTVPLGNLATIIAGVGTAATLTWDFAVAESEVDALTDGETVQQSYDLVFSDGQGGEAVQTVVITLTGTNDVPVISAGGDSGTVTEDADVSTTSGQLAAVDPDLGTVLSWGITDDTGATVELQEGAFGVLSIDSATGAWTYSLDNGAANLLNTGETVFDTFDVVVGDGTAQSQPVQVSVEITGANDAPVVPGQITEEILQDGVLSSTLTGTDAEGQVLTFALLDAAGAGPENGTLTLQTDGTYQYVPDAGFVGLDSFRYVATDTESAVSDAGEIVIAVESPDSSGDGSVALSINSGANEDGPAGSALIDVTQIAAPEVNVVFALDRSGSVAELDWDTTIDQVRQALVDLQTTFGPSETIVTVGFTEFSGSASPVVSFDLQDSDGWNAQLDALQALDTSGATNWAEALDRTREFLETDDNGTPLGDDASNFLFFITDGEPTTPVAAPGATQEPWEDSRDALIAAFDIQIDAFGIGAAFQQSGTGSTQAARDNLSGLDSDPDPDPTDPDAPTDFTALDDSSALQQALTETPAFNPQLVDLTFTLSVDGVVVLTADETSPALVQNGLDYQLSFASLPGIADLLGVENRFSVQANYDLDGDGAGDLTLFTSEALGRAETAQTIPAPDGSDAGFFDGNDLVFGSDEADSLSTGAGNDLVLGYDGDDQIAAGTGQDSILAGDGDDTLSIADAPEAAELLDGGAGRDVLAFEFANSFADDVLANLTAQDIEAIDLQNGVQNQLNLTLADVIDLSSSADTLLETIRGDTLPESATIYGDGLDTVVLEDAPGGAWVSVETGVDDTRGGTLEIYQFQLTGGGVAATIGIDEDIVVNPAVT